jgi:hypothetical protein
VEDKYLEVQMEIPEYVSKEGVQRVCDQLGIRDWIELTKPEVEIDEAKIIQEMVGGEALEISVEDFQRGLEIELEHGIGFSDANVTNNHPLLTGKIVLAHLKESLDYYPRLSAIRADVFENGDRTGPVRLDPFCCLLGKLFVLLYLALIDSKVAD